jgi:1-acyl-sn-glycerol-3-phosphate acyltransferase
VAKERLEIAATLADGESVFLFPEGSSSDGARVLPFRPGLLSAVQADPDLSVAVQPVSIVYGPAGNRSPAASQDERDRYAWYGDMDLAPHLWHLFGRPSGMDVLIHFHPPRRSDRFTTPRELAAWAHRMVDDGLHDGLGRPRSASDEDGQPVSACDSPFAAASRP